MVEHIFLSLSVSFPLTGQLLEFIVCSYRMFCSLDLNVPLADSSGDLQALRMLDTSHTSNADRRLWTVGSVHSDALLE